MKKLFLCVPTLLLFLVPSVQAADLGVYVAPKLIYAHTVMDKVKASVPGVSPVDPGSASKERSDDSFGGALAVGYNFDAKFGVPVRAELEYAIYSQVDGSVSGAASGGGYTDHFGAKQKMDIQTLFLNAYFDIKTDTPFTPYVGAGIGAAFINSKSSAYYQLDGDEPEYGGSSSKQNTNFAWNVGAGIGWKVAEPLTLDLGYRFASLGKVKSKTWGGTAFGSGSAVSSKTDDVYMHQVMLGLRWEF